MTPEQTKAKSDFDALSKKMGVSKMGDKGIENAYAAAYQRMVGLGMVPQLRKKYR
jgi:hypothetical protein